MWRLLTEPSSALQDEEQRYKARYITILLILATITAIPFSLYVSLKGSAESVAEDNQLIVTVLAAFVFCASYLLSRTRHYKLATMLGVTVGTIGVLTLFIIRATTLQADFILLTLLIPPTLTVSIIMSRRVTLVFMAVVLSVILVITQTIGTGEETVSWSLHSLTSFVAYFISAIMIFLYLYFRDRMEAEHLAALNAKDAKLKAAYDTLELLIAERTDALFQANQQLREQMREREQAEAALAEERTLLRTIIDSIPDIVFVRDLQNRIVVNNQAHREYVGATSFKDVVGKQIEEFVPPETIERIKASGEYVLRTGQTRYWEFLDVNHAGVSTWFAVSTVPLRNADGEITGLVCVSRDITEHKTWEEKLTQANDELEARVTQRTRELQQQSRMLDAIFASTPDHFYVIDAAGEVLYQSWGAAPAPRPQHTPGDQEIVDTLPHAIASFQAVRDDLFQHGNTVVGEWTLGTPADTYYYEYTFSPLRDDTGGIISVVCTIHDITRRKEIALSLEQSRA
ncbi:MAG: PAS domain S-box protein, partial [Anaerolineae bacterium]|nr:PAS domain S-box protein [Anaerolineae bacterium]